VSRMNCKIKTARQTSMRKPEQNLKETLIRVSQEIIEQHGLNALTLRGAARASGVSHMAPYRHFDDKDALLAAVAEKGFRNMALAMNQSTDGLETAKQRLRSIGVAYVWYAIHHPGLFRLMFSAGISDRSRFDELASAANAAFAVCTDAVANCQPGISTEALQQRALAVWSLVHGLSNLLIDKHFDLPLENSAVAQQMIGAILAA